MEVNGTPVTPFKMWKVPGNGMREHLVMQEQDDNGNGVGHFRLSRLTISINNPGTVTLTYIDDFLDLPDAVQGARSDHSD